MNASAQQTLKDSLKEWENRKAKTKIPICHEIMATFPPGHTEKGKIMIQIGKYNQKASK